VDTRKRARKEKALARETEAGAKRTAEQLAETAVQTLCGDTTLVGDGKRMCLDMMLFCANRTQRWLRYERTHPARWRDV